MVKIGLRLGARGDGKFVRHRARAESFDLRENEPHPVALFRPLAQLRNDAPIDERLSVNEALQIVSVVHRFARQSASDSGTGTLKPLSVTETRQYRPTR